MTDPAPHYLFRWIDRAFWLIWLGFPVLIWALVRQVQDAPSQLAALAPDQAACLADLPQVALFSAEGKTVFWVGFGLEMLIYAILLALAHQVVRRCARGEVFVAPMITSLKWIGLIIAGFPVFDLLLQNATAWAFVQTGDLLTFVGSYALDIPVLGVGLLLVTMAMAMRLAVRMHQDAELTI